MQNQMLFLLKVVVVGFYTFPATATDLILRETEYTVKSGETLSDILLKESIIGDPGSPFKLWGEGQWVFRNQKHNPHVKNWNRIKPGIRLKLIVPHDGDINPPPPSPTPNLTSTEGKACPVVADECPECPKCPIIGEQESSQEVATGGYTGFRYGFSLANGDAAKLLKKSTIFSLFVEVRKTMLAGLRYYYDVVPVESATINGVPVEYGWQRHLLGYAFGWDVDSVIDRINLTPKLGVYTLKARFPRTVDGSTTSEVFDISGALSLGYELDVEWNGPFGVVRPWLGQDVSGSKLGSGSKDSVSTLRYGLDAFFEMPQFSGTRGVGIAFLLFIMNENITISGEDKGLAGEDDFEIGINVPYAGAGLSLYW
jgi:hypothetical protein